MNPHTGRYETNYTCPRHTWDVAGTTEEIKRAVMECLREIYPRGLNKSGISITCFRGKTGADGEHLIGFGGTPNFNRALDELVAEGKIISNDRQGRTIFHYKTDVQPPAVSLMDEIKHAIAECLCRIHPGDLVRAGIPLGCFNDEYGDPLKDANGLPLGGFVKDAKIQRALDELVAEGKIVAHKKERDGEWMVHYRANRGDSVTPSRQAIRRDGKDAAPGERVQFRQGGGDNMPWGAGFAPRGMDLSIPEREDEYNEFKETFSVPVSGGKSNDVKMEVVTTVAAFANANGGRLFVGVRDDGKPVGLKKDLNQQNNSTDDLEQAIRNFLRARLDSIVDVEFRFSGEEYLVIVVPKRKTGSWVYTKDEDFYVRHGNQSLRLSPKQTAEYQNSH